MKQYHAWLDTNQTKQLNIFKSFSFSFNLIQLLEIKHRQLIAQFKKITVFSDLQAKAS